MDQIGYSHRSLVQKLGIKPGMKLAFFDPPESYLKALDELPEDVRFTQSSDESVDIIHFFVTDRAHLARQFSSLVFMLAPSGMLWISWPKGSSGVATDLSENSIREIGLAHGLVDIKVIAVDEVWSGLKFVYRIADRITKE